MYEILRIEDFRREEVRGFLTREFGSPIMVSGGKIFECHKLPGFIAMVDEEIKGLAAYEIIKDELMIVSLESLVKGKGIGTKLLEEVLNTARHNSCKRAKVITTNDNTDAMKFYQKKGFNMSALFINSIEKARKIKPDIPILGCSGIPIMHEIQFDMKI